MIIISLLTVKYIFFCLLLSIIYQSKRYIYYQFKLFFHPNLNLRNKSNSYYHRFDDGTQTPYNFYNITIKDKNRFCLEIPLLVYIQSFQIDRAKQEIIIADNIDRGVYNNNDNNNNKIKSSSYHIPYNINLNKTPKKNDLGFYTHRSYGIVAVEKHTSDRKNKTKSINSQPSTLLYYRIWKCGNDNIRALLFRYASTGSIINCCSSFIDINDMEQYKELNNFEKKLIKIEANNIKFNKYKANSSTNENVCDIETCKDTNINHIYSKGLSKWFFSASSSQFGFTFVRHPLIRFISGYSEIEYRIQNKIHQLPLFSKVGSIERLKEFIRMIVSANGSRLLFREKNSQLEHIAPFIGTLHMAYLKNSFNFKVYRLENFENEWKKLSKDTGFYRLNEIYIANQISPHKSSKDPLNTTKNSKLFFKNYLNNLYGNLSQFNNNITEIDNFTNESSYYYIRALCRIYLSDFLCTGYNLPLVCQDIVLEINPLIESYIKRKNEAEQKLPLYLRLGIPYGIIRRIANLYCHITQAPSPPQCVADIVLGKVYNDDDDDDDDDDDELYLWND